MEKEKVAYLGPEGTFSHLLAQKCYPEAELIPLPSILDVCEFAAGGAGRRGVVPVENSSGGPITETIDLLLTDKFSLGIERSWWVNIKLALLGKKGETVTSVYSHAVPMGHCSNWLRTHLPNARKTVVSSTATAAKAALTEPGGASIGSLDAAAIYGLETLVYPIEQDMPNLTQFYSLRLAPSACADGKLKTSLAAHLSNEPGSLCDFLQPFKLAKVNLSRIISRPVHGKPYEYAFYVDFDGDATGPSPIAALTLARMACQSLRVISTYPTVENFDL